MRSSWNYSECTVSEKFKLFIFFKNKWTAHWGRCFWVLCRKLAESVQLVQCNFGTGQLMLANWNDIQMDFSSLRTNGENICMYSILQCNTVCHIPLDFCSFLRTHIVAVLRAWAYWVVGPAANTVLVSWHHAHLIPWSPEASLMHMHTSIPAWQPKHFWSSTIYPNMKQNSLCVALVFEIF